MDIKYFISLWVLFLFSHFIFVTNKEDVNAKLWGRKINWSKTSVVYTLIFSTSLHFKYFHHWKSFTRLLDPSQFVVTWHHVLIGMSTLIPKSDLINMCMCYANMTDREINRQWSEVLFTKRHWYVNSARNLELWWVHDTLRIRLWKSSHFNICEV